MKNRLRNTVIALATVTAIASGSTTAMAFDSAPARAEVPAVAVQDHATAFDAAMADAATAEDTADDMATGQWPAVVVRGATWAGKQLAKGALTEAGKKLIGIW
ncbi:hypothetical protein PAB09_02060 [Corynebacterium sp. SCR221107]|uniref:hypothetical protein n=1 Tax=Corynebacterium sp. SCR221107 TaxID=3017361 RepID=UPI0022EC828A|nr:hypothetical protein [Corynebacterium sp. SCR221107]WBT09146.1 hypothetical protein PAB09_02060 [Corynebacterium sp. SCR221107]